MRYDGRYANQFREAQVETTMNKFADGSATLRQGDTVVHVAVAFREKSKTQSENLIYYPFLATNQPADISVKVTRLEQLLARCLATQLIDKEDKYEVTYHLTVQQDDGSLYATAVNACYLAVQQAVDHHAMTQQEAMLRLKGSFAAVTYASLAENEFAVDPDGKEEYESQFIGTLVMNDEGEFLDIDTGIKATSFSINRMNEILTVGQSGIEEVFTFLNSALYTDYSNQVDEKTIVIATNNAGKAREFEAVFSEQGYKIKTLKDFSDLPDVAETGTTFAENASLKAETIASILKMPVLADDSGLKVDVLGGLPGVYSARFAGAQKSDAANNAKLMHELTGVPDEERTAQFHCTLAFAAPGKETLLVEADWPGYIGRIPRGDHGFGYDPLFIVAGTDKTSAELLPEEKNKLSHRGQAIQKLESVWKDWLEGVPSK